MSELPFSLPRIGGRERARAERLLAALLTEYPDAHCELNYTCPHELLVATILSAQATDASVNKATPALFAHFPAPADYAAATPADVEPYIRTIGLFRNKAKSIHGAMKMIVERHGGIVPRTMAELLELPGVARKTANVILGECFGGGEGFVVDTHVIRLARRLGLAKGDLKPAKLERRLMALFPRAHWAKAAHCLIWHGRRACGARTGDCSHPICAEFGTACERRGPATGRPGAISTPKPASPRGAARRRASSRG